MQSFPATCAAAAARKSGNTTHILAVGAATKSSSANPAARHKPPRNDFISSDEHSHYTFDRRAADSTVITQSKAAFAARIAISTNKPMMALYSLLTFSARWRLNARVVPAVCDCK